MFQIQIVHWICDLLIFSPVYGDSDGKESTCNAGDQSSIPRSGRSPGEGNGNPLQYSCLENPRDRRGQWATIHGIAELDRATNTSPLMTGVSRKPWKLGFLFLVM